MKKILKFFLITSLVFIFIEISARLLIIFGYKALGRKIFPPLAITFYSNIDFLKNLVMKINMTKKKHTVLGYVLTPNISYENKTKEYSAKYRTTEIFDGIGIRDEIQYEKEFWGVVVGDSYSFCMGLNEDECWVNILEKLTSKQIINLGVDGYSTHQEFLLLKMFLEKLEQGYFKGHTKEDLKYIFWQITYTDAIEDKCFENTDYCSPFTPMYFFKRDKSFEKIIKKSFILGFTKSIFDLFFGKRYIEFGEPNNEFFEYINNYCKVNGCNLLVLIPYSAPFRLNLCRRIKCVRVNFPNDFYFSDRHLNKKGAKEFAEKIFYMIKEINENK